MRLSKTASVIAALTMATTGALAMSQGDAKAASVATTHSEVARLYNLEGVLIRNRALAPNTSWVVSKILNFKDGTMYKVATNEYLKASDSTLSSTVPTQKITGTINGIEAKFVYNDQIRDMTGKWIYPNTSWVIGKHIVNQYGQHYVQISAHEYIDTTNMTFSSPLPTPIYDAHFFTVDPEAKDNPASNTLKDYVPNVQKINEYFIKYLNALHAANGTEPVYGTTDMINYAQQRAEQQIPAHLDHSTATRDTSENLSTAGIGHMIDTEGIQSDKDAAYFILKEYYSDSNNLTPIGQPGHFGHRAALIYSGPNVGLGVTEYHTAFDADWNYATLDKFNQLYDYTGTNPDTNFISKDVIQ